MNNLYFANLDQLLDFINTVKDIDNWETVIFRLSASNGMELNINTRIQDSLGFREYTELKKLKIMLTSFYTQNNYLAINLEIKVKFPNTLKELMDPNDDYKAFYLNFYSDDMTSYMIPSFTEKANMEAAPVKNWIVYVTNLYTQWKKKNQLD
jgi:hypothetical protein